MSITEHNPNSQQYGGETKRNYRKSNLQIINIMKKLILCLLCLVLLAGCKKHPYSPCGCIQELEVGANATVYPGLYFGQTREEIITSGLFDSLPDFTKPPYYMEGVYGGLSASILMIFDHDDRLSELRICPSFRFYEVTETGSVPIADSILLCEKRWKECITQIYGTAGCFQRFETDYGWSNAGYWLWDVCDGGQYVQLFEGVIDNEWHRDLELVVH